MNDQDKIAEQAIEIDRLTKTIKWYQGQAGQRIGEAARAEIAGAPVSVPVDRNAVLPHVMPQAVQTDGESDESFYRRVVYNNGWNACRDFMFAGAAQPAAPLPEPTGPSAFLQAAKDFAQAHIDSDEIDSKVDRNMDAVTDGEMIASHAVYNSTKAKLLEAYRALAVSLSPAPAQPTGPLYEEQPDGTITEVDQSDRFEAVAAQQQEPSLTDKQIAAGCFAFIPIYKFEGLVPAVKEFRRAIGESVETAAPGASIDTLELNGMLYQFRHALTRNVEREYTKIIAHIDSVLDQRAGASSEDNAEDTTRSDEDWFFSQNDD